MDFDPTDPESVERARAEIAKDKAARREREVADFRRVMSEPHGRRFVRRLVAESTLYRSALGITRTEKAERDGLREQGIRLMREVAQVCPEHLQAMYEDERGNADTTTL